MENNLALITVKSEKTPVKKEQFAVGLILAASVGTIIAALAGGTIWGLLAYITGYEVGFMAWVIGVLSGFVCKWSALDRKGRAFQAIAIVSSLIGIAVGKYTMFFYIYRDVVMSEIDVSAASKITLFSGHLIHSFLSNINAVFSWLDVIWFGLAIFAAWEIPRSSPTIKTIEEPVAVSNERRIA